MKVKYLAFCVLLAIFFIVLANGQDWEEVRVKALKMKREELSSILQDIADGETLIQSCEASLSEFDQKTEYLAYREANLKQRRYLQSVVQYEIDVLQRAENNMHLIADSILEVQKAAEKAGQARIDGEKKGADEKAAAERKAAEDAKVAAEKKAADAKAAAERKAAEDARVAAEKKAAEEKAIADAKAAADAKIAAEKAIADAKAAAEAKALSDAAIAKQKAATDKNIISGMVNQGGLIKNDAANFYKICDATLKQATAAKKVCDSAVKLQEAATKKLTDKRAEVLKTLNTQKSDTSTKERLAKAADSKWTTAVNTLDSKNTAYNNKDYDLSQKQIALDNAKQELSYASASQKTLKQNAVSSKQSSYNTALSAFNTAKQALAAAKAAADTAERDAAKAQKAYEDAYNLQITTEGIFATIDDDASLSQRWLDEVKKETASAGTNLDSMTRKLSDCQANRDGITNALNVLSAMTSLTDANQLNQQITAKAASLRTLSAEMEGLGVSISLSAGTTMDTAKSSAGASADSVNEANAAKADANKVMTAAKAALNTVGKTYYVKGTTRNALNNQPLPNTKVSLSATGYYKEFNTDSTGAYTFEGVPEGDAELVCYQSNYLPITQKVQVNQNIEPRTVAELIMSPSLPRGNWRVVLTWKAKPRDLDSHAVFDACHVMFSKKTCSSKTSTVTLDYDDTNGYGPETTTIIPRDGGDILFYINNYSNEAPMVNTGAIVKLYNADGLYQQYDIPTTGSGRTWKVFSISNSYVQDINTLSA